MPASELMDQGSHAPDTGRQAEANSGSVPMHAHVHELRHTGREEFRLRADACPRA